MDQRDSSGSSCIFLDIFLAVVIFSLFHLWSPSSPLFLVFNSRLSFHLPFLKLIYVLRPQEGFSFGYYSSSSL